MSEQLGVTVKKDENFSEWYVQVVVKSDLADYAPVKGCMVIKPLGYAIWEKIQEIFNNMIKDEVRNVYFPMFIPERLLKKEAEHFEGFSPEVAWITHGGKKKLEERLAVRPTSETIMYEYFSKWIKSWRDLPLRINQWCNVVRWETKSTKLFIRTREFLWQEGHTAHVTKEEADEEVVKRLMQYKELMEKYLAIPVLIGKKSEGEKFKGALYTMTVEALMPDGKALQMGTSHNLGQNFSRVFNIKFFDKNEKEKFVWQTSWGISTRLIGAIVMVHGDDRGLVLPPKIAPIQIVIVPIYYSEKEKKKVFEKSKEIKERLDSRYNVEMDLREQYTPGYKFNEWELKGVPVRIEIGPKDIEEKSLVVFRRDKMERVKIKEEKLEEFIQKLMNDIQNNLFEKAKKFLESRIIEVNDKDEFGRLAKEGVMIKIDWCGDMDCEEFINESFDVSCRLLSIEDTPKLDKCPICGKKAKFVAYFSRGY